MKMWKMPERTVSIRVRKNTKTVFVVMTMIAPCDMTVKVTGQASKHLQAGDAFKFRYRADVIDEGKQFK
jgi:hypothetical protein